MANPLLKPKKIMKISPNDGETNFYLGRAYDFLNDAKTATKYYDKAVAGLVQFTKDNPDYSDGFYLLGKQGQIAQWGALIVGLAAAFVVFMTSESGKEFVAFGRDSWKEVKKVVWPSRKEASG